VPGDDRVSVGCAAIDGLLDGGLERGTVTQVYGPPASGKTNVALSAAVRAAAAGERAVYIDTEGISADRFEQLLAEVADDDVDALASRIVVESAHDFEEQREAVRDAGEFAPEASLIVLDSATGFYRLERDEDETGGEALRAVANQITQLLSLARKEELAVLVTNQVYTDPETDRTSALGGHTLDHWTGTILRLDRFRGGNRRATLEKHRSKAAGGTATFRIIDTGLEAADETA